MENEIWKDIPKYEGYYQASNLGNIRSISRVTVKNQKILGKILKKYANNRNGYETVTLGLDGKTKKVLVHRLVAEAFIPNPNNLPEVNHKDENKLNNRLENLEWCDRKYNTNYGTRNKKAAKKKFKAVNMYTLDMKFIRRFESLKEAGEYVNGNPCNIAQNCKQLSKSSYGYIWHWCKATLGITPKGKTYFKGKKTNVEE